MTLEMAVMWVFGGLLAAWLAGAGLSRGGYGVTADVILGLGGGLMGGWVFQALGIASDAGLFALVMVAFVGAAGMIVVQRTVWPTMVSER